MIKKGSIKYYVVKGIIGTGIHGVKNGIPSHLIHHAFNCIPCLSGDRRLRELSDKFLDSQLDTYKPENNYLPKLQFAYEFNTHDNRYYISQPFLNYLKEKYGGKK